MTITVTPVLLADLGVGGERMPVYVDVVDHPDGRVLVDTGIKELHPRTADLDPHIPPTAEWDLDLAGIDMVVNTHLAAGELDDPRTTGQQLVRALEPSWSGCPTRPNRGGPVP